MKLDDSIVKFYEPIVQCSNKVCKKIMNNTEYGDSPRGFFTTGNLENIHIMIVGKNPGHAIDNEKILYKNRSPNEIVVNHLEWSNNLFFDPQNLNLTSKEKRSLTFHINLLSYLKCFTNTQKQDVFNKVIVFV